MAFTIPDEAEAGFSAQAGLFQTDLEALQLGHARTGVASGCAVTAQGSPDMTVAVAAGVVEVDGVAAVVASGNVTITAAHASLARFDIVVASNAGTKSVVAGTAATSPIPAPVPASSVLLAQVYVPGADTAINSNQIIDKRVLLGLSFGSGVKVTGENPASINGYTGMLVATPPTSDEEMVALLLKMPDSSWGVGQDYAEGNYIVALSDGDNTGLTASSNLETISATSNATPVEVTTSTTHGWSTGDIVRITGTGKVGLDSRWWKITVTSTTKFTLNGSTAPGSTGATGYAFSDGSPVLARLDPDGSLGVTCSMHVATGLRGRSGSSLPTAGLWVDPAIDVVPFIIDNPNTGEWGPDPTADFLAIRDVRDSPMRKVVYVNANGQLVLRARETAIASTDNTFQVRDDSDTVVASIGATGILNLPLGSVSAPTLIFGGDVDTGITQIAAAANTMSFVTGGAQRLAIANAVANWADGVNFIFGTSSGNQLGTGSSQKIGFWGATPQSARTGWANPTGTATRTAFATSTVTLPNLAQAVKALIDDLKLIGILSP